MPARSDRAALGRRGERVAVEHLRSLGYRILARNFHTRYGELDIVAQDGDTVVFVEVKTRRGRTFGSPEEGVTRRKRDNLCRAALAYLQEHDLVESPCRFDMVGVRPSRKEPDIVHVPGAWTADSAV
jgi:putative endonuclease